MNYYINEQNGNEKNALTKARQDAAKILEDMGWQEKRIHRKIEGQNKLVHYFRMGYWTWRDWHRIIREIEPDSNILIQFPMINSLFFNEKAAQWIKIEKQKKNLKIILLIHDIDSIRFPEEKEKQYHHEQAFYEISDAIIAHNHKMKLYLEEIGLNKPIIELGIFDYQMDAMVKKQSIEMQKVVIAGNLNAEKAQYLNKLDQIKKIEFQLYGPNFSTNTEKQNVIFRGVYKPEELPEKIDGAWGLVWDGVSIDTCEGGYGNYLKYNNPHKLSFYMAMGMPVIIWKEAALAEFVEKNHVGITVEHLSDIEEKIEQLGEEDYLSIKKNVEIISKKVRDGVYLRDAVNQCITM